MAKKNTRSYSARTKSGSKGVVITLVALLLGAAIALTAAIGSKGFTEKNVKKWFKGDKISAVQPDGSETQKPDALTTWGKAYDNHGNEMLPNKSYSVPEGVAFASLIDEDQIAAYDLDEPTVDLVVSANLSLVNFAVQWDIHFADGSDCTDKVSVIPYSQGNKAASVVCHAPFDKQIILKVTDKENPEFTAQTTIDYVQRLNGISNFCPDSSHSDQNDDYECALDMNAEFGVGTIAPKVVIKSLKMRMQDGFISKIKTHLIDGFNVLEKPYTLNDAYLNTNPNPGRNSHIIGYQSGYDPDDADALYQAFPLVTTDPAQQITKWDGNLATGSEKYDALKYAYATTLKEWKAAHNNTSLIAEISFEISYNGTTYQSVTYTTTPTFNITYSGDTPSPDFSLNPIVY